METKTTTAVQELRALVYEIEGGNRWPVAWDDDSFGPCIARAKKWLAEQGRSVPEWKRRGPGFKREPLPG